MLSPNNHTAYNISILCRSSPAGEAILWEEFSEDILEESVGNLLSVVLQETGRANRGRNEFWRKYEYLAWTTGARKLLKTFCFLATATERSGLAFSEIFNHGPVLNNVYNNLLKTCSMITLISYWQITELQKQTGRNCMPDSGGGKASLHSAIVYKSPLPSTQRGAICLQLRTEKR